MNNLEMPSVTLHKTDQEDIVIVHFLGYLIGTVKKVETEHETIFLGKDIAGNEIYSSNLDVVVQTLAQKRILLN